MRTKLLPCTVHRGLAAATALAVAVAIGAPVVLAADRTGPSAPRNLTITPERVTEDGLVDLEWVQPRTGTVSHYEVHRYYGTAVANPAVDETTLWMETADLTATDELPAEGTYRYAVVAVDPEGDRSVATAWRSVLYDDPANGERVVEDATGPAAPTGLAAEPAFTQDGAVTLTWEAPEAEDLYRYLVYRSRGDGGKTFLGYVEAGLTYFDDELSEEGTYGYTVVAQDLAGNLSRRAEPVQVVADWTAPEVTIRTPEADKVYRPEGSLAIRIRVKEEGAGYEDDAIAYFLNGDPLASPVIPLAELADGTHTLEAVVVDRAGNAGSATVSFAVDSRLLADAPEILTESGFTSSLSVSFEWEPPLAEGVTGYSVYRAEGDGEFVLIGTTAASVTEYTDTVPGEGRWSYRVAARYGDRKGEPSGAVVFTVDRTAPTIRISSPADGETYPAADDLAIAYKVRDLLAGVDGSDIVVDLDGAVITASRLDLTALEEGEHTLTVEATDRAGNTATAQVTFTVVAVPGEVPGEEPVDDEALRQQLLRLLEKWEDKIHHGQLQALKAKAMNGNWAAFVHKVQKFSGKFIHPDAAEELLAVFGIDDFDGSSWWKAGWCRDGLGGWKGDDDGEDKDDWKNGRKYDWDDDRYDDDDDDDDDGMWVRGKSGKGNNNGKGNGNNNGKGNSNGNKNWKGNKWKK